MRFIFRKNFKVNKDEETKPVLPVTTWKEKWKKWNRSIAFGFAILIFLIIMSIVTYNIFRKSEINSNRQRILKSRIQRCFQDECKVECDKFDEEEDNYTLAQYIIDIQQDLETCAAIKELAITEVKFNQSQISNGWLKDITPPVETIRFLSCTLTKINQGSFAGHPFNATLDFVRIENAFLETFTRHSLLGADSLVRFEFCSQNKAPYHLHIEKNALEGVKHSLQILEFAGYKFDSEDIINLTHLSADKVEALALVTLKLQNNIITELRDYSLGSALYLQNLHLSRSYLEKVSEFAFQEATHIRHLDLSDNLLETLPENVFKDLSTFAESGINLSNNYWKCNCSLQWLQTYYNSNNYINRSGLTCKDEENKGKSFENAIFCTESSTISSSSSRTSKVTTASPITTDVPISSTTLPAQYEIIKCQNQTKSEKNAKIGTKYSVEIKVDATYIKLSFYELEGESEDPLRFQVNIEDNYDLTDYNLVWFNTDNNSESSCRSPVEDGMVLLGLNREVTYSFSLLYADETKASPKCTFCIKTEPEWRQRTWITNQYQAGIIASTVCIPLILIVLTSSLTFLCIRRYPKVIASNKSVIIVKPKTDQEQEETYPKEYERPAYWEPYVAPSNQGYLTPKLHRYSKVKYRTPLTRSMSEWSFTSTNLAGYDNPEYLHTRQLLKDLKQNPKTIKEIDDGEYRPPLPPPNPGSQIPRTPIQEELYSNI